jgi:hypothetical protein
MSEIPQPPTQSILDQVRAVAEASGRRQAEVSREQLHQVSYDEGLYDGIQQSIYQEPSRFRWFMFGVVSAYMLTGIIVYFYFT